MEDDDDELAKKDMKMDEERIKFEQFQHKSNQSIEEYQSMAGEIEELLGSLRHTSST